MDGDERDNQLTGNGATMANINFVDKISTDDFDDLVVWISPGILFNRMIASGRLP